MSPSFADVFARFEARIYALNEAQRWDEVSALLHETLDAAPGPAALWRVLMTEPIDWMSWTADGGLTATDVEKVFVRALAWDGARRASGLAIVGALATLAPSTTLVPDSAVRAAKVETLAVLDAHLDAVRALAADRSAPVRAAAALLLARATAAAPADLLTLMERAEVERAGTAVGATLLAAGILFGDFAARGVLSRDECAALGERLRISLGSQLREGGPVASSAAATALALLERRAGDDLAPAMRAAVDGPRPLPVEWGFFDGQMRPDSTLDLVRAALEHVEGVGEAVAMVVPDVMTGRGDGETLLRLAFGPMHVHEEPSGRATRCRYTFDHVPPGGVALAELTPPQRAALVRLAALSGPQHPHASPLGFQLISVEIPAFLEGRAPRWRPLEVVDIAGVARRWHGDLLWRRSVLGGLAAPDEVLRALCAALSPGPLLDLVLGRMIRIVLRNQGPDDAQLGRDLALLWALLDALEHDGYDTAVDIGARVARHEPLGADDAPALGACLAHVVARSGRPAPDDERSRRLLAEFERYYVTAATSGAP